jgi:hypothetical protein
MHLDITKVTDHFCPMTMRLECQIQLRKATKYHQQLLKIHQKLRHQGLLILKEIHEKEGKLEAAEIIRKVICHELHKDDIEIVRALKNPKGKPQISKHGQCIEQWRTINPVFHPEQH